ncbi:MAG TPA: TIM barrel protein [Chloroflexota bacterium]|nr:TIM barrel protein [Chloroflexota bacterium]
MTATDANSPSGAPSRLSIGLAAYSLSYSCGFEGAGTARAWPRPYDAYALMDLATDYNLAGVEFPPQRCLPSVEAAELEHARGYAAARDLFIVADTGVVDVADLQTLLPIAAALGARTVRAIVSTILCGDRRAVRDTWPGYLAEIGRRLHAVRGLAEELQVSIALENHQDMTSDELVALCEDLGSPRIGVTLDAINPLAVGEDPLAFARRVAPYLKHVHLKDYYLYRTVEGFRLVRCAVGAGVLDVPGLLSLCARQAPQATLSIEIGSLYARHVRLLEDEFWQGYPPRRVEDVLPVLRLREQRARPADEEWRTPWERGEQGELVATYEAEQVRDSVHNLRALDQRTA